MITLPTQKTKPGVNNPRFAIFFGKPKAGKSSLMASLEDNLIIDLENGYQALSALVVQARSIQDFADIANALREKKKELGRNPYKYITIDNATRLEEMCQSYAIQLYKATPAGKNYQGNDIRTVANGAGYLFLRTAVRKVIDMFKEYADYFILVAHVKDKLINRDGEEMTEMSIDLTGKLGDILCGEADAIGYVYRKKNQTIVSFESGGNSIAEARAEHLRGKKIVVAESDEDGKLTIYMDKIYLPKD